MSETLPEILTSYSLTFDRFPNALIPGVFIEFREGVEGTRSSLWSKKKHGYITNVPSAADIEIVVLHVPGDLNAEIQKEIGPMRHSTIKNLPELVFTAETKKIKPSQVFNFICVFLADEVIDGGLALSGMVNYYVIRHAINEQNKLTTIRPFLPFVSLYEDYQIRHGMQPCIQWVIHELRQEIMQHMQTIMCNSGLGQGLGATCRQNKSYGSFGKRKWSLLVYLLRLKMSG